MGMAISNSPERVDDAHAHGANPWQQAAGNANQNGKPKAKGQKRFGKDQGWKQTGESYADNRNEQVGESQTEKAANESNNDGLREYKEKNSAPGEADGLEHSKLADAFANGDGHGVAGDQKKGEEDDATDGENEELDVSELLGEICGEGRFCLGFGFKRRIGKLFVDSLGDAGGVIGAIKLDHIPSGRALDGSGRILVKVFPLQPKLALVATGAFAVINAVEIELRRAAAIESRFDGDTVADFPMEARGGASAGNGTHTVFQEIVPLVVRHHKLGHHFALVFRVDYELWEEVFFVLIDPAEPVIVSDGLDARN